MKPKRKWVEVDRITYKDKAVEVILKDQDGNIRRKMITPPRTDCCSNCC